MQRVEPAQEGGSVCLALGENAIGFKQAVCAGDLGEIQLCRLLKCRSAKPSLMAGHVQAGVVLCGVCGQKVVDGCCHVWETS